MKLAEWLKQSKERRYRFASRAGISPSYITELCREQKQPSLAVARRIMEATEGAVRPDDFFADKEV